MLGYQRKRLLAPTLVCLLFAAACGGKPAPQGIATGDQAASLNTLSDITVKEEGDNTVVEIVGQKELVPNVFKLTDPPRIIIDFTDTQLGDVTPAIPVNNGVVGEITTSQFDDVSSSLSRVVIGFDLPSEYDVKPANNRLTITIPRGAALAGTDTQAPVVEEPPIDQGPTPLDAEPFTSFGAPEPETVADLVEVAPDSSLLEPIPVAAAPASALRGIDYQFQGGATNIQLLADGEIANYSDFVIENPKRLVVDLMGIKKDYRGKSRMLLAQGPVQSIRTGTHPNKVRVVVDLKPNGTPNYTINRTAEGLNIDVMGDLVAALDQPDQLPAFEEATPITDTTAQPFEPELPIAAALPAEEVVDISQLPLEDLPVEDPWAAPEPPASDQPLFAEEIPLDETAPFAPTPAAAPLPEPATGPYEVTSIDFTQAEGASRLIVQTTQPATYTTFEEGSDTVILNLRRASIPSSVARFLNTSGFNSPVAMIAPKRVGPDTRVVVTLREPVPYNVSQEGNYLYVDFSRTKDFGGVVAQAAAPTGTGAPELPATAAPEPVLPATSAPELPEAAPELPAEEATAEIAPDTTDAPVDDAFAEVDFAPEPPAGPQNKFEYVKEEFLSDSVTKDTQGGFGGGLVLVDESASPNQFRGRKINLDFKDADLRALFRLFADISKLNIIVGDDVQGKVTIKLENVPWDQAFAILLQTQNLGAIKYGSILRIAPAEKIQKERELHAQAKKAAIAAAPLDTLFKAVSYASANELGARIQNVLSERGTVDIDSRTNTLIIRDVREKLVEAKRMIEKLDAQTPQVTIEARIVEATTQFIRNWGIEWGGSANFSAGTGNPTGLLFPNSIGVTGATGDGSMLLSYPPIGTNAGARLNFGSISGVLDLDLFLGYQETEGNAKLISSPKVTVLDNKPATILSGRKIPFVTQTANSGTNVRFESAVISIEVTPHITADGAVIMQVSATRNEPDFGNQVQGNPAIVQREATTEVLVKSGNTTVIGGIYQMNRTRDTSGFPFIRKIPIIGWFFSSDNRTMVREELLIFITPRIVTDDRTAIRQNQG